MRSKLVVVQEATVVNCTEVATATVESQLCYDSESKKTIMV